MRPPGLLGQVTATDSNASSQPMATTRGGRHSLLDLVSEGSFYTKTQSDATVVHNTLLFSVKPYF